ncbi:MAG TPA: hypothetical protein VLW85_22045 [Myxococcales bacterium]|nr:hypothetical protein [Myxococcales bacterium]
MKTFLSLACLLPLAALAQRADDPRERLRAMREWHAAPRDARTLEEARRERDRWAIGAQPARLNAAAVAGTAFVSLGPTHADSEYNDGLYFEVDSGRARAIVPDPVTAGVLYFATSGGGVWKSFDSAQHWEPISDALGSTSIGTFAMDPMNPQILFIGLGDPFDVQQPGLVRSGDGGATWSDPAVLSETYAIASGNVTRTAGSVLDIKVDPDNSLVVMAATDAGLFRSTDGGMNWSPVALPTAPSGLKFYYLWSLAWVGHDTWLLSGQEADISVPSEAGGTGATALFRSTDDGASWTWNAGALPGGDATAALGARATLATAAGTTWDPTTSRVYLLTGANDGLSTLDLFRSDDGGQSFQALGLNSGGRPTNGNSTCVPTGECDQSDLDVLHLQAWYNQALVVDPQDPDTLFVGGDKAMVRSSDGGLTWSVLSDWLPALNGFNLAYVHADFHAFAIAPDGTFYAGSDGGIGISTNALSAGPGAVTFTSARNDGLVTHLVYTVACAPETWPADLQSWVAGGMQDNGTRVREGNSTTFNQVFGGDGIGVAVGASAQNVQGLGDVPALFYATAASSPTIVLSNDGGQSFIDATTGITGTLPFFVRLARDTKAGDVFLTYTSSPPAFYRTVGAGVWADASGHLHWQDSGQTIAGFNTVNGQAIGLRNLAAHPAVALTWGAISNRFTYVTTDGGVNWLVGLNPAPTGTPAGSGIWELSSIAFDPDDTTGRTYYVTSVAGTVLDAQGNEQPLPGSYGHLYKTGDGGLHWTTMDNGVGLPFVGFDVIKVDPGDSNTLYLGTELGLYRSQDRGASWARFGAGSLPMVEVRDLCITPGSKKLTAATYGRGFWQISTDSSASVAGVRGTGDTNFDSRIDGRDLIDLADAFGSTQASPTYSWQADLTGATNAVDASDLAALLAKFGGAP